MVSFHSFGNLDNIFFNNIWCLLKVLLKHCAQTIFQGGSPWASLILNSMIVLGVLYCVQPFSEVKTNMVFYPVLFSAFIFLCSLHFLHIFLCSYSILINSAKLNLSHCNSLWIPMTFLWDFFGIPIGIPWYFYWWHFYGVAMGVLLDSFGISVVCLWCFYGIAMGFLLDFHCGSLEFL